MELIPIADLPALIAWAAARPQRLPGLPPGNGILPDVLALAGIARIAIDGCAEPFRWEGLGGAVVAVLPSAAAADGPAALPLRRGHLPATAPAAPAGPSRPGAVERLRVLAVPPPALPGLRTAAGRRVRWQPAGDGAAAAIAALPPGDGVADLVADARAAAPGHWEVSPRALDNGIVRAEFAADGGICRLCWDGRFAALAEPIRLGADWQPIEAGPVRARLRAASGAVCELVAGDEHLTLRLPAGGLRIATRHRGPLRCAAAGAAWMPAADAPADAVRWAAIADAATAGDDGAGMAEGIAVAADRALAVRADGGDLALAWDGPAVLALARPGDGLGRLALDLDPAAPAALPWLRLAAPAGLAVHLVAADAGGAVLAWAEQAGRRGRAWIHGVRAGASVDAHGTVLAPLPATAEGDGVELGYAPGAIGLIRLEPA